MRRAVVSWLPGTWRFVEADQAPMSADSLAVVQVDGRRSALMPAGSAGPGLERFTVFRVTFPADADNSGFVGWLGSTIREATGSGVAVVCGHDRRYGGVFDYWAVPDAVAEEVRHLLARVAGRTGPDSLDGVVMTVSETAANARIGKGTVFCFSQDGTAVTARYGGGRIVHGWLAGRFEAGVLEFRYLQVEQDGAVDAGNSTGWLSRLPDGRRQLIERFAWETGEGGGTNRMEELKQ
jgi:hypothetical protein